MSDLDMEYRLPKDTYRGYGVTLHYKADRSVVAVRSHVPYVMTDSRSPDGLTDAYPADMDFAIYSEAMLDTIDKINDVLADLTARRDALVEHLELASQLGCIPPGGPTL